MAILFTPGQVVATPDWEAVVAQHDGIKSQQVRTPSKAEESSAYDTGSDADFQRNPIYRTYFGDGTYVETRGAPNGADFLIVAYTPSQKFQQTQRQDENKPKEGEIRGPQTGPKREVFRSGQWVVEDNPVYQPPASQTQPQTVSTNTTEPYIVTRMPNGTITTEKNPNYKGPDQKPSSQVTVKGGDGKTYIVSVDASGNVTTKDSGVPADQKDRPRIQDPETKDWLEKGDDGVWRPIQIAGRGGPQSRGPEMPDIILGQTTAAARLYADQLSAEVAAGRMTPGQRAARMEEFFKAADLAVRESNIQQAADASNLNARVNLATTRQNASQNALTTALDFVSKFNDKLPEGSDLGGKAFAALLGMQMLQAKASGIYDIRPPNEGVKPGQGALLASNTIPVQTVENLARLTNPNNPAAVEAQRQQVAAQVAAAAAPPAASVSVPAVAAPPPPTAGEPGGPPLAPGSVYQPPPPSVTASQAAAYEAGGVNPATGDIDTRTTPPPVSPMQPQPLLPHEPGYVPTHPASTYGGAGDAPVQMAPPSPDQEFAIMSTMQPSQPQAPVAAGPDMADHPLLLRQRAESVPPWRLSDAELQQMQAAGIDDETIWGVPTFGGRSVA
jgi:hypothetical protein